MLQMVRPLTFLVMCGLALGCTTDPAPADTGGSGAGSGGGEGGAGAGGGAGGSTASTSSTTGTGGKEPGTTTLKAEAGLLTIPSGQESVKCVTVSLENPEAVFVRKFRTSLNQGSHHMIVYQSDQPPNPDPVSCTSFGVEGGSAIFIAQQKESALTLPTDNGIPVGLELQANQSLTLEIHYINTTPEPIDVIGTVELDVLPSSANVIKSGFNFQGAFGIPEIPAFGEADTGVQFESGIPGVKVFALTTHQHKLGTRMQVWRASGIDDLSEQIADSTTWSDPPLELFDPPLEFPSDGSKGFAYQCHWKNPTANTVYGGLGANDEMCFFWSYYYPVGGAF